MSINIQKVGSDQFDYVFGEMYVGSTFLDENGKIERHFQFSFTNPSKNGPICLFKVKKLK